QLEKLTTGDHLTRSQGTLSWWRNTQLSRAICTMRSPGSISYRLQTKWEAWADAATDADMARQVPFKSRFVGNAGLPAWQIVMHVVNHATLHRGQIVGMLRQLGVKPPTTDIVFYCYEQAFSPAGNGPNARSRSQRPFLIQRDRRTPRAQA